MNDHTGATEFNQLRVDGATLIKNVGVVGLKIVDHMGACDRPTAALPFTLRSFTGEIELENGSAGIEENGGGAEIEKNGDVAIVGHAKKNYELAGPTTFIASHVHTTPAVSDIPGVQPKPAST